MKKIFKIFVLLLLVFIIQSPFSVSASSCTLTGNTTFCDDGTSYTQTGNTTFGSDGTSYTRTGNTTFGSNGTSCTQTGNTTFCSDGTSYTRTGSTIFGSDGSSYLTTGNTTFGSGGGGNMYSTCPANSSSNSSGGCSCNYGYSVNYSKTACVYTGTYIAPTTPSCPLNSYYDGVSSCKCDYGYVISGSMCVLAPAPTKTNTQICQASFGSYSNWNGTKNSNGNLNCICKTGSQWNSKGTACIAKKQPKKK